MDHINLQENLFLLYHEQNQFMIDIRRSPIVSKLPMALLRSLYHDSAPLLNNLLSVSF